MLVVVFFTTNAARLTIFSALHARLFGGTDMSIATGNRLFRINPGLTTFQLGDFTRIELAGFQTVLDTLLLIDIAFDFSRGRLCEHWGSQKSYQQQRNHFCSFHHRSLSVVSCWWSLIVVVDRHG